MARSKKTAKQGDIVNPRIAAVKAGLDAPTNILESHYLAGGNVERVVNALISADKANIELGFNQAAAIDLAGRDVFEALDGRFEPVAEKRNHPERALVGVGVERR